jgi:hypothetical protein
MGLALVFPFMLSAAGKQGPLGIAGIATMASIGGLNRSWDDIESSARSDWQTRYPGSDWERYKAAANRVAAIPPAGRLGEQQPQSQVTPPVKCPMGILMRSSRD